jgi:hypothetical protein
MTLKSVISAVQSALNKYVQQNYINVSDVVKIAKQHT